MPSIDWPLDKMRQYKPDLYREPDFEPFWKSTLAESKAQPLKPELIPYALPSKRVECFEVRYEGFGGGRVAGWYLRPRGSGKFPALMQYHGYSGRGQRPLDVLAIAEQGIAVMTMDTRGQNGLSEDHAAYPGGGHFSGWMTKGIRDPKSYYYRYVYTDAVRAVELLASQPEVDSSRIAATGISQGGGITLAATALSDRLILAMADVPFLCDYRRAIEITPTAPYTELSSFLKSHPAEYDRLIRTLSYCDNLNLAPWITCRTVICNCLWDDVCPPSTIFAAYNHIPAEKSMEIYPYHKHEVPYEHSETRFKLLMETLNP
ncbi:MAG TPA: acetylxylan esterase [Tepidisphaeraceae bacterium]|nr:acetylxylan esterase [Tepidisphaeraceae bacterium]